MLNLISIGIWQSEEYLFCFQDNRMNYNRFTNLLRRACESRFVVSNNLQMSVMRVIILIFGENSSLQFFVSDNRPFTFENLQNFSSLCLYCSSESDLTVIQVLDNCVISKPRKITEKTVDILAEVANSSLNHIRLF